MVNCEEKIDLYKCYYNIHNITKYVDNINQLP